MTEKRRCLQLHVHIFVAYRNYVRRRHNDDGIDDTPAALLGLLPRRLTVSRCWPGGRTGDLAASTR
ncbi:MAG: hypothetical protein U1E73_03795 [Planctomycetota bacterium]